MHESRGFVRACVSQLDRGSGREKTLTKLKRLPASFIFFFLFLLFFLFYDPSFRIPTILVNDPAGKDDGKEPGPFVFPPDSTAKRPFNLFFSTTTREGSTIIGPLVISRCFALKDKTFSFLSFPWTRISRDFFFLPRESVYPSEKKTKSKLACPRSRRDKEYVEPGSENTQRKFFKDAAFNSSPFLYRTFTSNVSRP